MKTLLQSFSVSLLLLLTGLAYGESLMLSFDDQRRFYLQVEVAGSVAERQRGLMWRKHLPLHHGLIMLYPRPRKVAIWMKNTYIPLDILFLNKEMEIVSIAENAEPLSLQHIHSNGKVAAVLEINAGMVSSLGLRQGMKLQFISALPGE